MSFTLHPTLAADTAVVTDLPLCTVLLMDDRHYPWLILVPRHAGLRDVDEVPEKDVPRLHQELRAACAVMRARYAPHKLNVAALGNQVPQLHIHVIGRFEVDGAWPKPVWGVLPREPYGATQLVAEAEALEKAFGECALPRDIDSPASGGRESGPV